MDHHICIGVDPVMIHRVDQLARLAVLTGQQPCGRLAEGEDAEGRSSRRIMSL